MENCGNFIELAAERGADVGVGKMFLLYPQKTKVNVSALTATAINAAIEAGTIIGVIKNWHTVAGAPVAETNVERPLTAEMKIIRQEILADTLSFESNICNRSVVKDLVAVGTVHGILLDDRGNAFGAPSDTVNSVYTMPLNFSGKTSTSLQRDNASDKMVSVTVRYLVDDISMLDAGVEVEDVAGKVQVMGQLAGGIVMTTTQIDFDVKLINKCTQKVFEGEILTAEITARTKSQVLTVDETAFANGILNITLTGTGLSATTEEVFVTISGDELFMKETKFTISVP